MFKLKEDKFEISFKMLGGPKHIIKYAILLIGGGGGITYLCTEKGNSTFIHYNYPDEFVQYGNPKFGNRRDIKGEHKKLQELRKINVQPVFQKQT